MPTGLKGQKRPTDVIRQTPSPFSRSLSARRNSDRDAGKPWRVCKYGGRTRTKTEFRYQADLRQLVDDRASESVGRS